MLRLLFNRQAVLVLPRSNYFRESSGSATAHLHRDVLNKSLAKLKQNRTRTEIYGDLLEVLDHRVRQLEQPWKRERIERPADQWTAVQRQKLANQTASVLNASSEQQAKPALVLKQKSVRVKAAKTVSSNKDAKTEAADKTSHLTLKAGFENLLFRYVDGLQAVIADTRTMSPRQAELREVAIDCLRVLKEVQVAKRISPKVQNVHTAAKSSASKKNSPTATQLRAEQKVREQFERDILVFLGRVERFNSELAAYVDACLLQDEYARAQAVVGAAQRFVVHASSYGLLNGYVVHDRTIFDRLIAHVAPRGDYSKLSELITMMRVGAIRFDYETVASCLEAIGFGLQKSNAERSGSPNTTAEPNVAATVNANDVQQLLAYAATQIEGFQLSNLPVLCARFRPADRVQAIVAAARLVDPRFEWRVESSPSSQRHECTLLRNYLNSSPQSEGQQKPFSTNPHAGALSVDQLRRQLEKQVEIELNDGLQIDGIGVTWSDTSSGASKKSKSQAQGDSQQIAYRKRLERLNADWRGRLAALFTKAISEARAREKQCFANANCVPKLGIAPFLTIFDTSWYVDLMLHEAEALAQSTSNYSLPLSSLQRNLGFRLMHKAFAKRKRESGYFDTLRSYYDQYLEHFVTRSSFDQSDKLPRLAFERLLDGPIDFELKPWPVTVLRQIGKFLYDLMIDATRFDVRTFDGQPHVEMQAVAPKIANSNANYQPAFFVVFRQHGPEAVCELKVHPVLLRAFDVAHCRRMHFDATELPMLVPPVPWMTAHTGGYLLAPVRLIRSTNQQWQDTLNLFRLHAGGTRADPRNVSRVCLEPSLDALNVLGNVPWRINKPVLDLVTHIFRGKGDRSLSIPVTESSFTAIPRSRAKKGSKEHAHLKQRAAEILKEKREMYSLWSYELYRLSIAHRYADEVFWLPHTMDFRSRVYPTPPHFNHISGDVSRSILKFAVGKPLGPKGLDWLKIHCVNLTGSLKKATIKERLEYANSVLDQIIDSAERPLDGKGWWRNDEDPWQTLACCIEIRDAIRSGDPANYVSHVPVHQDGSCNGSQHYAALGRDARGAHAVNVSPSDSPQDLYGRVTELVEQRRVADAERGVEIAAQLEGFVRRKVIKQPIMTSVYGVTSYGARQQIQKQLKELDGFDKKLMFAARSYLADQTFSSFGELFASASRIQQWLVDCANVISAHRGRPVQWVTPLGLPVLQPYYKEERKSSAGVYAHIAQPNTYKQKNAFPPNYIHSLDSAHMMLTALECWKRGVTFVSVHDCFWTHAADVDQMNQLLRQTFYSLHSQPLLRDLSNYLHANFSFSEREINSANVETVKKVNETLSAVPPVGNFDLRKVLESTYFFS